MKPRCFLARIGAAALCAVLSAVATPAAAQSDVFVCVDAEGRKTYQNTGDGKSCRRLDIQPMLTVPAPRVPAGQPAPSRAVAPASFPRVDAQTQRARDSDRRKILGDEMQTEASRLAALKAEFNNGEPERRGDERNYARYLERVERLKADIQRSENNIESLKRELALANGQQ
jgi:Domain of unknown function (DUF4124)